MKAWGVLLVSGLLEAVWATALAESQGFSRPVPVVVFLVAAVLSMVGLARAMRHIPVGTAYAVWTGIGAVTTAAYAMATGAETATGTKVALLAGIIGCVVGLQLTERPDRTDDSGMRTSW
ncbi:multidrug efflux SMR transporter [Mariniluteicoccus endophyticus]